MRRRSQPKSHGTPACHEWKRTEGATVRVYLFDAVPLITIDGNDMTPAMVENAIVRVIPEASWSHVEREHVRDSLKADGAAHVWFAPTRPSDKPIPASATELSVEVESVDDGIRALMKVTRSHDPDALEALVVRLISEAGA